MLVSKLGKFTSDQSGGIAIISAFALPAVLGISCLAVEYGHGLLVRGQNQRTADLAAYAAALTYNDTNSDSSMLAAAKSIAAINGVAQDAVTARIVESRAGTAIRPSLSVSSPNRRSCSGRRSAGRKRSRSRP